MLHKSVMREEEKINSHGIARHGSSTLSFASTSALALSSNLHSSFRPFLEAWCSDVLPLCKRRKQVTATQGFSIPIDFKSELNYSEEHDRNGRSNQCLDTRQVTLSSSVERSHARSRAGLRASTRKDDTQGNDWESTKEKNQTPLSSTSRCVPCCYDESCPPLCPSHAHIIVML